MPGLVSAPWVGVLIPLLFGVSVFLFALSLLPTKNVLSEQLEELKARDPYKRDDLQSPLMQRVFTPERRMALGMRLAESGWYTTTPTKFALRIVAGACFGAFAGMIIWRFFGLDGKFLVPLVAFITFIGGYLPFFTLNRAA